MEADQRFAKLSKIVKERNDGKGGRVPCLTWDNATICCDVRDKDGEVFPMYLETKRMSPGSTDEWVLEVYGVKASARFTSSDPNAFYYTDSWEKEQAWCRLGIGFKTMHPTITGGIFEFGFTDAILQMWGYLHLRDRRTRGSLRTHASRGDGAFTQGPDRGSALLQGRTPHRNRLSRPQEEHSLIIKEGLSNVYKPEAFT